MGRGVDRHVWAKVEGTSAHGANGRVGLRCKGIEQGWSFLCEPFHLQTDGADDEDAVDQPALNRDTKRPRQQHDPSLKPMSRAHFSDGSMDNIVARIAITTDSSNMSRWVNGTWKLFNRRYQEPLQMALRDVGELRALGARPSREVVDWTLYVPRELNEDADQQSRMCRDSCELHIPFPWPRHICVSTDGGVSSAGAGCGWIAWGREANEASEWTKLASASWKLPEQVSPPDAEFLGLLSATKFLVAVLREGGVGRRQAQIHPETDVIKSAARPRLWRACIRARAMGIPTRRSPLHLIMQAGNDQMSRMRRHDEGRQAGSQGRAMRSRAMGDE